jgi:murein DD-endopeptidase MepM/ murein hydrolase activator NlpD
MATAPIKIPMRITQTFGQRPLVYAQFGLKGHNGLDIGCPTGTQFFAMLPGVWHLLSQKDKWGRWTGYGAAWRLHHNQGGGIVHEWTFAHLQSRHLHDDNKNLPEGQHVADTDNTGFSTAPHLHIGLRILKNGQIQNYNNGFHGSIDPLPVMKKMGLKFV